MGWVYRSVARGEGESTSVRSVVKWSTLVRPVAN